MNFKTFIFLAVIHLPLSKIVAQVKIGGVPGAPVSSAVLELDGGGNKALRLPIINSKEQLGSLANPVNGLVVYGSHTGGLIYYHGGSWYELNSSETGFKLPHTGIYETNNDAVLKLTNNGTNGIGIHGISSEAAGVFGFSGVGTGVRGGTADGFGVEATSIAGIGLKASSQSGTTAHFSHLSPTGKALIVENGNVGIGTNNPAHKLDLNGDLNLTGRLRTNGYGGANGQVLTSTGTGIVWSTIQSNPQVGYHGTLSESQNISASNSANIRFDNIFGVGGFNDGGGSYDITPPAYKLPSFGVYHISASVAFSAASGTNGSVALGVELHGGALPAVLARDQKWLVSPHSNAYDILQASVIVKLPESDYNRIRVVFSNQTNGTVEVSSSIFVPSYLSIIKVY
jgi:hypothetical protein